MKRRETNHTRLIGMAAKIFLIAGVAFGACVAVQADTHVCYPPYVVWNPYGDSPEQAVPGYEDYAGPPTAGWVEWDYPRENCFSPVSPPILSPVIALCCGDGICPPEDPTGKCRMTMTAYGFNQGCYWWDGWFEGSDGYYDDDITWELHYTLNEQSHQVSGQYTDITLDCPGNYLLGGHAVGTGGGQGSWTPLAPKLAVICRPATPGLAPSKWDSSINPGGENGDTVPVVGEPDCDGMPRVGIRNGKVFLTTDALGPGFNGNNAGLDGQYHDCLKVLDCARHYIAYWDHEGRCHVFNFSGGISASASTPSSLSLQAKAEGTGLTKTNPTNQVAQSPEGYDPAVTLGGAGSADVFKGSTSVDGYTIEAYERPDHSIYYVVTSPDGTKETFEDFVIGVACAEVICPTYYETNGQCHYAVSDKYGALQEYVDENGEHYYYITDPSFTHGNFNKPDIDHPAHNRIESVTGPDGTYTVVTYVAEGYPGEGKISSIVVYDHQGGSAVSTTTYGYYQSGAYAGNMQYVERGSRQISFTYGSSTLDAVEQASGGGTVYRHVFYDFNSGRTSTTATTTMVRKAVRTGDIDRTYVYTFSMDGAGNKADLLSVTEPNNATTSYTWTGNKPASITSAGVTTSIGYNSANAVTSVVQAGTTRFTGTYYMDSQNYDTLLPKTYKDGRGNYVHFVRSADTLDRVLAIQVAPASVGTEPTWGSINDPDNPFQPVCTFDYYGGSNNITSDADLTYDAGHSYSAPDWTPTNLKDGLVGMVASTKGGTKIGREDVGNWDCMNLDTLQGDWSPFGKANVSYWTWTSAKTITGVDLIRDPSLDWHNLGGGQSSGQFRAPENLWNDYGFGAVQIDAWNSQTNTYDLIYYGTDPWASAEWNGQSVAMERITKDLFWTNDPVVTTKLRITYGAYEFKPNDTFNYIYYNFYPDCDVPSHLGEVVIHGPDSGSDDVRAGKVKKVTVPDIDGNEGYEVSYDYLDNGKVRSFPTQISYKYWNGSVYETKTTTVSMDQQNRTITVTDAKGSAVTMQWDALQRPWKVTPGYESKLECCTMDWSKGGNDHDKTHFGYNDVNWPTKTWTDLQSTGDDTSAPLVEYEYDSFGNIVGVKTRTDGTAAARETSYTYDTNGVPATMSYPSGLIGQEQYGYSKQNKMYWAKDGNGKFTWYVYDDLGRVQGVYYGQTAAPTSRPSGGASVSYSYDGGSNLVSTMTDGVGTSCFYYNALNQLAGYCPAGKTPSSYMIRYDYNGLGEKASIKIGTPTSSDYATCTMSAVSYEVYYDYYANGLLKKVKTPTKDIATYSYDEVGNLLGMTYGNGVTAALGRGSGPKYELSSIAYSTGSDSPFATFSYGTRDGDGNPASMTDSIGTWSLAFDWNNRLTGATPPNGPVPDQPAGGNYVYDWVGNRTSPPADPHKMEYNAVDQLTRWPGMYQYSYYGDGSLHQVTRDGTSDVAASYSYGPDGQLQDATFSAHTLTNTWDGIGNRVGLVKKVSGQQDAAYGFVYDVTAGVPAVLEETRPDGSKVQYYRTPDGVLIASRTGTTGNPSRYYHFDGQGSTRCLTGSDGTVTDRYTYDPFGKVISHTGSTTDNPYQYVGALGYYTHWQDPEFRLLQLGYRFYDAETGSFTQQDPLKSGINWYAYGGLDPWGLKCGGNPGSNGPPDPGFWHGVGTGTAAVGSAFTFGIWDGGRWKDEPGFKGAKYIAYGGMAVGAVAGGIALAPVVGTITVTVTSWAPAGVTPTIVAGRWVVIGGPTVINYLRTIGPAISRYPITNYVTTRVPISQLGWPPSGVPGVPGILEALLGQFVIK